jgi:hypothetical protein
MYGSLIDRMDGDALAAPGVLGKEAPQSVQSFVASGHRRPLASMDERVDGN